MCPAVQVAYGIVNARTYSPGGMNERPRRPEDHMERHPEQPSPPQSSTTFTDLKPHGWRNGATWTYLVMLLASGVALLVSFVLSAETLQMARHPGQSL